ncbi:uncharacterized protein LOC110863290 isoform X2 [Folsomia candida]|nr:uncharacterized protein LOC110863290 isoform X2 [Folsomia candida]
MGNMTKDRVTDLDNRILPRLKDGKTFMAVDQESGKIAGVMIIAACPKDKDWNLPPALSPMTSKVTPFLVELEGSVDMYNRYGVDTYADIFILSVSQDFTGHGLGTELLRRAISWISEMGYQVVQAAFTNPASRRIGEKFGFVEVSRRYLVDAKDDKGNKTMPNADKDQ